MFQGVDWGKEGINSACMPDKLPPLLHVIKLGRLDLARVLIDLGANVKKSIEFKIDQGYSSNCFSPMKCAALYGHDDILKALFEEFDAGTLESCILQVGIGGSVACLEYLVSQGVDINGDVPVVGHTLKMVHLVVREGHCTMLKKLTELGSDVNVKDSNGNPPIVGLLELQDAGKRIAMYRALQSVGANFEITYGYDKQNILHSVTHEGFIEDIKVLATICPALIESQDNQGCRPVHYAADHNVDTLKCLIELSADVSAVSRLGHTALDIALNKEREDCIDFLTPISPYTQSIPQNFYNYKDIGTGKSGMIFDFPENMNSAATLGSPTIKLSFPYAKVNLKLALLIKSTPKIEIHSCILCELKEGSIELWSSYDFVWFQRHNKGIRLELNFDEERIKRYLQNQADGVNSESKIVFLNVKSDDDQELYCNTLVRDLFLHSKDHLEKEYAVRNFNDGAQQTNCTWFCISFLKQNGYTIDKRDLKRYIESIVPNAALAEEVMKQFSILYKRNASELAQIAPRLFKKRKESQGASNNAEPANPIGVRETMGLQ